MLFGTAEIQLATQTFHQNPTFQFSCDSKDLGLVQVGNQLHVNGSVSGLNLCF